MRGALFRAGRAALSKQLAASRSFAAEAQPSKGGGGKFLKVSVAAAAAYGGYYWARETGRLDEFLGSQSASVAPKNKQAPASKEGDYDAVRKVIADLLEKDENYDDGSYGPILVRLAWHASGSYDKASNTGGSNGATMRFNPELGHGANAGLHVAQEFLEPAKKQFPWITYADLWTLAGAQAIEEMGGPHINWRPGRSDQLDGAKCPPDGRLPDASKGAPHIREVFQRMGFDDRELVALSGAHALGRCHTDRSGYVNPWTNAPTTMSNQYFVELLDTKWTKKKWDGPLQYEDPSKELMMLPTDMALIWDKKLKPWVQKYAKDEDLFFKDFASAFSRLLELGVPFDAPFKPAPA